MSLISTLLPVLMRQQSFSLTTIGLLQFIKLPWILKLLWAPLVDRNTQSLINYKRWIWGSELCYALCLLVVACLDLNLHFSSILSLVVFAFVCSATQDIATDALTSRSYEGDTVQANKLQAMGQFVGTILGGGLLMFAYQYLGWSLLFSLLALATVALLIPLQLYRQELSPRQENKPIPYRLAWSRIISFFTQAESRKRILLLLLYNIGLAGTMAMMKPYLVDKGYSLGEIAWLYSLYGAFCAFVGSIFAGRYLKSMMRTKALLVVSLLIMLTSLIVALIAGCKFSSLSAVMLSLAVLWFSYGASTVMIYAVAMDYVREQSEGTDFTLQIVLLHLSSLIIAGLSGKLSSALGYIGFFYLECGLAIIALFYVYYLHYTKSLRTTSKAL